LFNGIWLLIMAIAMPWLAWRFVFQNKNRRGWAQKLFGLVPVRTVTQDAASEEVRIWLQAVSVGEVHLLIPIVRGLLRRHPNAKLFISTTTETGFDRASELFGDQHSVFFWPSDFSWAVHRAFDRIRPDAVVLIELELWPNFIDIAKARCVEVIVANGRLSESSFRGYHRLRWLLQPTFGSLSIVGAQNEIYAQRFVSLGCPAENVCVTGNIKYDGVETERDNPKTNQVRIVAKSFGCDSAHRIFLAGSTQIEDEVAAVEAYLQTRESMPELRLVIVPRHPFRKREIESLLRSNRLTPIFRSETISKPTLAEHHLIDADSVIVVDVIGELSGWWGLAAVAFVGGSMGSRGGQNMIEPAAFGVPVCFGPNTKNFRSTVSGLLAEGGAVVVQNSNELARFLASVLSDNAMATGIGQKAQKHVLQHQGATERTLDLLEKAIPAADYGLRESRAENAA
jgi:3-deoxy-D-manno-octulosonic-acid transferase